MQSTTVMKAKTYEKKTVWKELYLIEIYSTNKWKTTIKNPSQVICMYLYNVNYTSLLKPPNSQKQYRRCDLGVLSGSYKHVYTYFFQI